MKATSLVIALGLLALPLAACQSAVVAGSGKVFVISGAVVVRAAGAGPAGSPCVVSPLSPYAGIRTGAQIVVQDPHDGQIGAATLGRSVYEAEGMCWLPFRIRGVPDGEPSYTLSIGFRQDIFFRSQLDRQVSFIIQ